jgi:MOSC domain-containing protein
LKRLRESHPEGDFAPERFRPNMVLDCGDASGFIEQPWRGHLITAASGAVLEGTEDCKRCALTTRAQGDLPSDPKILHTVMLENNTSAGIYAKVSQPGRVALGDLVSVER